MENNISKSKDKLTKEELYDLYYYTVDKYHRALCKIMFDIDDIEKAKRICQEAFLDFAIKEDEIVKNHNK